MKDVLDGAGVPTARHRTFGAGDVLPRSTSCAAWPRPRS